MRVGFHHHPTNVVLCCVVLCCVVLCCVVLCCVVLCCVVLCCVVLCCAVLSITVTAEKTEPWKWRDAGDIISVAHAYSTVGFNLLLWITHSFMSCLCTTSFLRPQIRSREEHIPHIGIPDRGMTPHCLDIRDPRYTSTISPTLETSLLPQIYLVKWPCTTGRTWKAHPSI
jgi:hypothetical protein